MNYNWVTIKVKFQPIEEERYKVEICGFTFGLYDEKNNWFLSEHEGILYSATSFKGDNIINEYFAFPIKISKLINDKKNSPCITDYFNSIKKYEHYCCIQEKSGEKVNNFYSLIKNNSFCKPFYFDWNTDFDSQISNKKGTEKVEYKKIEGDFTDTEEQEESNIISKYSRKEIISMMKDRIVGQDSQIELFVTTILSNLKYAKYENLKDNIFIIGPTGSGKTEMCRSIANFLSLPIIKKDITKYTCSGYKGLDILTILEDLFVAADYDLEKAEKGIVILDEFDKLGKNSDSSGVRTTDVQEELLGLLGNDVYDITIKGNTITIDTSKITFVLAGACQKVFDKKKKDKNKQLGFNSDFSQKNEQSDIIITKEDLKNEMGLEPELLRRVNILIQTNELKPILLKRILKESSISNFRLWSIAFFEEDNIFLKASDDVLMYIADEAYKLGGGASGLQSVVTNTLSSIKSSALDGELCNCDVIIGIQTISDPTKYLVKKRGKRNNDQRLSEANE